MQVVILSGGAGSRLCEENFLKPKPMIEIAGRPIIWYIMKYFSSFGMNDFLICLGYKQYIVKSFFADYFLHTADVEINVKNNSLKVLNEINDNWDVKLIDTGIDTLTAGRLKRVEKYLEDEFFIVYGDSLGNINLNTEIESHKKSKKILTLCTVKLSNQKGVISVSDDNIITSFREKNSEDSAYVNSGYMIANKGILNYIDGDNSTLEDNVFPKLLKESQINSYKHDGFWQFIDKQNDITKLCNMINNKELEYLLHFTM